MPAVREVWKAYTDFKTALHKQDSAAKLVTASQNAFDSHRSPTVDILGSYFPAWMICIVIGLTLTLIAHWIVQARHWQPYVGPAPLIYTCLMIIFTFATWILFYQN
jgi:YtcA family